MIEGLANHEIIYKNGKAIDYVIIDINPAYEKITGLKRKDVIGKKASELYTTGSAPYLDVYAKVASDGIPQTFETYFEPMGKYFSVSVFSPEKGKFATVFSDISERKSNEDAIKKLNIELQKRIDEIQIVNETLKSSRLAALKGMEDAILARDALHDSEERFRIISEASPVHISVSRVSDGSILYANNAYVNAFGYNSKEIIGRKRSELWKNPKDRVKIIEILKHQKSVSNYEAKVKKKDGTIFWVSASISPIKYSGEDAYLVVSLDITERKKAQDEILRAKIEWERTFNCMPDLIAILDKKQKIIRVNNAFSQHLGIPIEQCINLNCYDCVHLNKKPSSICPHKLTMKDKKEHLAEVYEEKLGGYFLVSTTPIFDNYGALIGSVHVARDINERKKIEMQLRETRDYLENLLNYANAPIIVWDKDFKIIRFNHAFEHLAGYKSKFIIGKNLDILFPQESKKEILRKIKKTLKGELWDSVEIPILQKNGQVRIALWNSANVYNPQEKKLIATIAQGQDITERKQIETALKESEKRLKKAQEIAHLGSWELDLISNKLTWSDEVYRIFGLKTQEFGASYEAFINTVHPDDRAVVDAKYNKSLKERQDAYEIEHRIIRKNGEIRFVHEKCEHIRDSSGKVVRSIGIVHDITEQRQMETELKHIEWLLTKHPKEKFDKRDKKSDIQPYGNLTIINRFPLIKDSVGTELLNDIVKDYLDLLETSAAIYEKNGDYAMGIFTSSWCKFMDLASRNLCNTRDNQKALSSGKWLCHESCWAKASKVSMQTGRPADIECEGGINIYAVPIKAGKEIVGSINFGYGSPPRSTEKLKELALKYKVNFDELHKLAYSYQTRPQYIIELAKVRLETSARLIGEIISRKKTEENLLESEEKYRRIVENTTNVIMVTQPDGIISYLSPSCKEVLGYNQNELINTNPNIFYPDDAEKVQQALSRALKGEKGSNFEYRIITKQGSIKWVSHSWSPIFINNQLQSVVSVIEDITQRKETEDSIKELNENLMHQAIELSVANKELEAFSYSVSHDLRAPLRSIDGFSQALIEDYAEVLDEQGKEYLQRVKKASQHMGQLIDDLLKLSRLTRAEMTRNKINLSKAAENILNSFKKEDPTRKIEFVIQDNLIAEGDSNLLNILLENLLRNAWKFTKKCKQARIEFGKKVQNKETVFFIRDNGAGFDMKYSNKLFIPFQRLHDETVYPGTGIGLGIVSRIVHRHGGQIWAEAEENKGATFYFTLGGKRYE